jgi:hypothetical protein
MNKEQRKRADAATELLNEALGILRNLESEEQEKYDNLPEGLQAAETGQKIDEAAQTIGECADTIEEAIERITERITELCRG